MPDQVPDTIVQRIKNKECILFLGASASSVTNQKWGYTVAPPNGNVLAKRLAEACHYPHADSDNLLRVSWYYQLQKSQGLSRQELIDILVREIDDPGFMPSAVHRMLAALPFPIVITTNYDRLFDTALSEALTLDGRKKAPQKYVYFPDKEAATGVPLDPKEDKPVLFKLHGDIEQRESIVITEEDYITFIQRMGNLHPSTYPIPESIAARMKTWSILFIGYSLKDWNLRLLLRALRWHIDRANISLSFSVDPFPDELIVSVLQDVEKPIISFIRQDLWTFVPELYTACMGKVYSP